MLDKQVITARLEKLRDYIHILQDLRRTSLELFKRRVEKYGLAERYLHLSIECMLDIGTHIISSLGYETPATYDDVFKILGKHGILSPAFVKKLEGLAGFRNILVHDYIEIDHDKVYSYLKKIEHFEKFEQHIAQFLKQRSK